MRNSVRGPGRSETRDTLELKQQNAKVYYNANKSRPDKGVYMHCNTDGL